jgi:hypothetical protein
MHQDAIFFVSKENREFLINEISCRSRHSKRLKIEKANEVCNHVFDLLGSGPTSLGNPIPWHLDFISKKEYPPKKYYKDITPAEYPGGHDIKVPWELSRCQHFAWLGQAYWLSGDEKYAEEFVAEVNDWIEKNPPQLGVNWVTAMDVAIRAVNWLWGYHFFIDSPRLTDEFIFKFFKSLLSHGRHIVLNLENSGIPNNHYLSNLVGLLFLGILMPQFNESEKWLSLSMRELDSEIRKQIRDDGVDFEASTSYHRLVTELLVSAAILAKQNGQIFSHEFYDRLEKMIEFLMHVTRPDGTSPVLGDIDNGRLQRLQVWEDAGREWVDFRNLLAIGAVLFNRTDFASMAGDQWEEAFWLLGRATGSFLREKESWPKVARGSHAFPSSGIYVLRANGAYMIVHAGPPGQKKIGGHAHNDALSFEVVASDQTWIIDPGTYVYTSKQEARNRFRSTSYHATAMVDGQEINRIPKAKMFEISDDAEYLTEKWLTCDEFDYLRINHSGYKRLPEPVIHRREFFFDKIRILWLVWDTFSGTGSHSMEWNWPIPPELTVIAGKKECTVHNSRGDNMQIVILSKDEMDISISSEMVSPAYGILLEGASFIKFSTKANIPAKFQFALIPNCSDRKTDLDRLLHAQKVHNHVRQAL